MNRKVARTASGIRSRVDPKQAEVLVEQFTQSQDRAVTTPGVQVESGGHARELSRHEVTMYRAAAARLNYLAADRPGIGYAVKEISRRMANPTAVDTERIVRVANFMKCGEFNATEQV